MNEEILKELYSNGSEVFDLPDFETFKADMQDESMLSEFRDSMISENFDIPDLNTFKSDIGFEVLDTNKKEEEKEDGITKYKSDIDITEFFSKDPKTQKQKDFSYFDKDFDKLNEDVGGFFGNLEETIVKDLDTKFKKWGFAFEEAEVGSDAIKVISTKDPDINKTFSLDNPNQGMYAIKSFIDKNKRDNAVYADQVTDIDVSDDYIQDLFKATADKDEDKKNKLLTGISRKIFASEGINYDEIKNLESKGETNQDEINFIENKLINTSGLMTSQFIGGDASDTGRYTKEYKPTEQEIIKYSNIFNDDGSLKIVPYDYSSKLKLENEKLADITTNEAVYQVRVKEKLLFDKFKNKETSNITEQVDEIAKVSSDLSQKFKSITGSDVSDFTTVNKNIENNLNTFEQELINVTGKGFDDLDKFEPTTQEELDQVQDIVNRYNIYYQQTITPVNNLYSQFSSLGNKQKQISDIGNTINSMLSFDDLYKYRGQYEDSKFQSIKNNAWLGWSQGKVNADFLKAAYNVGDPLDEEEIAGIAKNVAEEISYQKGLLTSDTWERYQAAGTVAEQLKILGTDPGEVLLSLFGNSMGMFAGTGKNIALPLIGGSAAAGAVIGGTTSLGAGILPGAFAGFSRGLIAWQTITGFNMELGSAYSEELTKAGYDLSDADQVVAGLRNPEVVAKANKRGIERGIPIAVANFIGARAAGALVNPLATTGK